MCSSPSSDTCAAAGRRGELGVSPLHPVPMCRLGSLGAKRHRPGEVPLASRQQRDRCGEAVQRRDLVFPLLWCQLAVADHGGQRADAGG